MAINEFLITGEFPLITALILGLLVAINPCQLAINVSALTYIYKRDLGNRQGFMHGLLYVLGRSLTYTVLGWVLICLIGGGKNVTAIQSLLSHGETILPYLLLLMGLFMLYRGIHSHHHTHGDDCHNSGHIIKRNGPLGALMLGVTLAFAFCPESAVFYFGVMLPLAVSSSVGILLPLLFALGAALPVLALSWVMFKATNRVLQFPLAFEKVQKLINLITGAIFFVLAITFFLL